MAKEKKKKGHLHPTSGEGTTLKKRKYFFLNGDIHSVLSGNRGLDRIVAWNYPKHKKMVYTWTDVVRRSERAWSMSDVCRLLGRDPRGIQMHLDRGNVPRPQYTYTLVPGENSKKRSRYFFKEEEVLALAYYLATIGQGGRPGFKESVPTQRELAAAMRGESKLYVRSGDQMIPAWRAEEIW